MLNKGAAPFGAPGADPHLAKSLAEKFEQILAADPASM